MSQLKWERADKFGAETCYRGIEADGIFGRYRVGYIGDGQMIYTGCFGFTGYCDGYKDGKAECEQDNQKIQKLIDEVGDFLRSGKEPNYRGMPFHPKRDLTIVIHILWRKCNETARP